MDESSIVVDTEVRTQQQSLYRSDVGIGVTEDTPDLQSVVAVVIEFAERVLTVAHATHRTRERCSILFVDRHGGRHFQCILQRLAVHLVAVSDGEVLADGDDFVHLVTGVDASRDAFEVGVLQDTVVLLVTEGQQSRCLLSGIRDREVVVLCEARARDLVEPVGVAESHSAFRVDVAIVKAIHSILVVLARCGVIGLDGYASRGVEVQSVVRCVGHGVESVVEGGLCHRGGILLGVGQFHHRLRVVELSGQVGREVYLHLVALLARARRDDDHTIGRTRTIDRSRGSVLQHLHRLNVVHVQRVQVGRRGHTVDNEQRVLRGVERTDTTDAHRAGAHGRTIVRDGHARHLTLQCTHRVGVARCLQFICLHHCHRTRQVGLALHLITSDDDLSQFRGILLQLNLHALRCGNLHGVVSDVSHHQHRTGLHLDLEVAVEVGHRTVRRSFLLHGGTNDTFASLIDHRSRDFRLRVHYSTRKKSQQTH